MQNFNLPSPGPVHRQLFVLVPVLLIGGYAISGVSGLAAVAVSIALALVLFVPQASRFIMPSVSGLLPRDTIITQLDDRVAISDAPVGVLVIEIDQFKLLKERYCHAQLDQVLKQCLTRMDKCLRDDDIFGLLDASSFLVVVGPDKSLDLEAAIQLATRLQRAIAEPIHLSSGIIYLTASIGFCLSNRLHQCSGESMIQASTVAMIEAQRSGPSAIRSYSDAMRDRIEARHALSDEVADALENGQVRAFFQPQISTRTRDITGFETLARWHHPTRGLIPPNEFLPACHEAGLMNRLGQLMVDEALTALKLWDEAGYKVPRVGVNFSSEELSDPSLIEWIKWALDKFDLSPDRLGIEVLETVVASKVNNIVVQNLATLAEMGCGIDLDDFGTGHASITSIRRFSIERIKIDRSFVSLIDEDVEQQNMVSAILTMAERLGLDALAEGVETPTEEAMLAQLGCAHVQGFGIARPMPLSETQSWISGHNTRKTQPIPLTKPAILPNTGYKRG